MNRKICSRVSSQLVLTLACVLTPAASSLAAEFYWRGGAGESGNDRWNDAFYVFNQLTLTNWVTTLAGTTDAKALPGASDNVRFSCTNPINYISTLGTAFSVNSLITEPSLATPVYIGTDPAPAHQTLTLGSAGIVANSTQSLFLGTGLFSSVSLNVNIAQSAATVALTGKISAPTLTKIGPGTLFLGDTTGIASSNAFTSAVLSGGLTRCDAVNALPVGCNVTLKSGTLELDNTAMTLGNIGIGDGSSSTGRVLARTSTFVLTDYPTMTLQGNLSYNGPGDPALVTTAVNLSAGQHTFDNPNAAFSNSFYDVTLTGGLSGSGDFIKSGATYLALTNTSNHTGSTTVNAGRLYAATAGALSTFSPLIINSPGQLLLNPPNGSANVTIGNYNQTVPALSGNGAISLGSATLTVSPGTFTTSTFSGAISGTGALTKSGTGKLVLSGSNTYTNPTTIFGGQLQIGDGGITGSVAGDISNGSSLAFNRSDPYAYIGTISGSGSVIQAGAGTLIFPGTQTYTGGTTIWAGALQIGSGGTTGFVLGNITNNANLTFNRSNAVTFLGTISGTGSLTKLGAGTLTLLADNTYAGPTTISAGTLQLGNVTSFGSIVGNIIDNSVLVFLRINSSTFPTVGEITGTGTVSVAGGIVTTHKIRVASLSVSSGRSLTITTNSGVSAVDLLSNLGSIDLTNNALVVRNGTLGTLRAAVASAALKTTTPTANTTLAVFPNVSSTGVPFYNTYTDLTLASTDVIVRYTYIGDTNIDGVLDGADFANLIEGYSTGATGWQSGDFNYDGAVNSTDFSMFTTAYNAYLSNPIPLGSPTDTTTGSSGSIPDPSSLSFLLLLPPLLGRPRRQG